MTVRRRSILEGELRRVDEDIIRLASMVESALDRAMDALYRRDVGAAVQIALEDQAINHLRYEVEQTCFKILATQQPAATDLRVVIAAMFVVGELERMGDHAAGIARLVERMAEEDEIETLHKLPKMAKRAGEMIREAIAAFVARDAAGAEAIMKRDDKLDRQYRQLFQGAITEMQMDEYIRRATYLLWVGHNLERMGDRAINVAERVIFMVTNQYIEDMTVIE